MKKLIIILTLIMLAVSVNAKCGDNFCDPNEDCTSCPDDCLCTKGPHNELIECCNDFSCQECENNYCQDRKCNGIEGFTSMFEKISCDEKGVVEMKIKFLELDSVALTPEEDLRVYMKEKKEDDSFSEIKGTWVNPSREGEYQYTKISDTSTFTSNENIFKKADTYYVRVKYKIGRSDSIFDDFEVTCPGIPVEQPPVVEEEPEVEEVEPPREEVVEQEVEEEISEEIIIAEEPEKKSYLIWYIIGALIIAIIIFLCIKYEIKVSKKI